MPAPTSRVVFTRRSKERRPFPPKILFALLALGVLGAVGGGLIYFAHFEVIRMTNVEVNGVTSLSADAVAENVRRAIRGDWWGIVPQDNFFLVSGERIEHGLREHFPGIQGVNVDKRFPRRLVITITERVLWGVYCQRLESSASPGPCVYLDENGVAYEELAGFEGWLLPVIYGSWEPGAGHQVLSPAVLEFFVRAKTALAQISSQPLWLAVGTSTPSDVRIQLTEGWELWVSLQQPLAEWMGVLQTVLEKEIGGKRDRLEYVDLRFGNKVFYKLRSGE